MRGALAIGLAQVLALVPGTSRSGITMTAARFLGLERTEAARFSMLLAIPAILGATILVGYDLLRLGDLRIGLDALVAIGLSFLVAWLAIAAMMAWLSHATFTPFVIYRVILGVALLWFVV
jgi:undecaprenyl-diphosphatase